MSFYEFNESDKVNKKSTVRQLVDILAVDIAGEDATGTSTGTRKKYETFVTGGLSGNPVTSSLFQTVFDQDFSLQTSNEMLDFTIGSYARYNAGDADTDPTYTIMFADTTANITVNVDNSKKPVFDANTLMMREKINLYKQYAQMLLGDSSAYFTAPYDDDDTNDDATRINQALFINIKRLFTRDGLDKEKFSMKIGKNASTGTNNLQTETSADLSLITDVNASSSLTLTANGGNIGTILDSSSNPVGLIFYESGILVLDAEKVFNPAQIMTGTISGCNNEASNSVITIEANDNKKFIPDIWVSGSIDNILDHICETRFGNASTSAMGLINKTSINSTIYFCRVAPNDANFSTNPTYTDVSGNLRCIEEKGDDPFAYVTTIGLYDPAGNLLAVAKTSRPIEKNPEVDLSISVRIDY
tara:strand:- start:927 stop:2174 length:1248 start_codon:yes stop_codon:yes gene_type:complete